MVSLNRKEVGNRDRIVGKDISRKTLFTNDVRTENIPRNSKGHRNEVKVIVHFVIKVVRLTIPVKIRIGNDTFLRQKVVAFRSKAKVAILIALEVVSVHI